MGVSYRPPWRQQVYCADARAARLGHGEKGHRGPTIPPTTDTPPGKAASAVVTAEDRLLVLAPHPDDETLATGTLLQRAVTAGASVRVAFVTSGDNNPWAQRAVERRWHIGERERLRFGRLREGEALAALGELGVPPALATFLRFPDQGLTELLLRSPEAILAALVGLLAEVRPTLVAYPSLADLHPDHSALGVLLRVALRWAPAGVLPRQLGFLVHHPALHRLPGAAVSLPRTASEAAAARRAVAAHRSQHVWRRGWMTAFLEGPERFFPPAFVPPGAPLSAQRNAQGEIRVTIRSHPRWRAWGRRTLVVVRENPGGGLAPFELSLRGVSARATIALPPRPGSGETFPAGDLTAAGACFVKLERRFGFFDEGGWIELPPGPTGVDSSAGEEGT
mgnify:CR=1 FL=1